VRTTLLSLKMAEAQWIRDRTGQWPVMLLDEIMAELDDHRRSDLLSYLGECDQTLLTTTDLKSFSASFMSEGTVWHVQQGVVTPGS
jgi:DNA replication and repair protein RecF